MRDLDKQSNQLTPPELILGSQSVQRRELLATLGIPFSVVAADVDEQAIRDTDLARRALLIAKLKAETIAPQFPQACIITADTFLALGDEILEKPKTLEEAETMLSRQSNSTMSLYTGCCVWHKDTWEVSTTVISSVSVRPLSDQAISRYVSENPVTTWAAGFSPAFASGMALISDIQGSFTSVLGLPVELIVPVLQKLGYSL